MQHVRTWSDLAQDSSLDWTGEQCSECGVRLTGPLAGGPPARVGGKVIPLIGYRQVVCRPCREAWLAKQTGH